MKKLSSILIILALVITMCVGCGEEVSRADLESQNQQYAKKIEALSIQVEDLKEINKALGGNEVPDVTTYEFSDGTSEMYVSVGGSIILPGIYEFEEGSSAPNTASVNITSNATVQPSSNWAIKQDGTKTMFYHQSGIAGYIKAIKILNPLEDGVVENSITSWLNSMSYTVGDYNSLFLEDYKAGGYMNGTFGVASDNTEEATITDMRVKVGLFGTGDNAIEFMFTYPSNGETQCDELVMNLLKTLRLSNRELRVE